MNRPSFVFFGTSTFSIGVLEALRVQGYIPTYIITTPDKPQGRNLVMTAPPVKSWAIDHRIPFSQPTTLRDEALVLLLKKIRADVFIVASYGKIIPETILDIPPHHTLNVHPSLLPHLRGASPLQATILEKESGAVSIIRLDTEMDHGPILIQKEIPVEPWPPSYETLEHILATEGGTMLAHLLPEWIAGTISEKEQDHSKATYTKKIKKSDGEISLSDDPLKNFKKIQAYRRWPGTFFFAINKKGKKVRVIISDASLIDGSLIINKVIPEGKKEMDYRDFLKGL